MLQRAAALAASMGSGYRRRDAVGACTESLGSESGDVGGDAEIDQLPAAGAAAKDGEEVVNGAGLVEPQTLPEKRQRTERLLPPAMPRSEEAFMRAERRGGRLILTEVVRAVRREVFRASRADGRLRLRFAEVPDDDEPEAESNGAGETESAANGVLVAGCCNGGEFCQVAAGTGRCVEIGAVLGI